MRWVLLLVVSAIPWAGLRFFLLQGRRSAGAAVVAIWALILTWGLGFLVHLVPGFCARVFPGAATYAQETMRWVETGQGCEGDPACFVPQHVAHLAVFLVATLGTGGLGGLLMATVLFGWMGAYTGELWRTTGNALALAAGWHPWAVLRVAGFVSLGVAFSEPLLRRDLAVLRRSWRWWTAGFLLVLADMVLKGFAAGWWRTGVLASLFR